MMNPHTRGRRGPGSGGLVGVVVVALLAPVAWARAANAEDPVLYQYSQTPTFDGEFGPIAAVQRAIGDRLQACGSRRRLDPDGRFGRAARDALAELASCRMVSAKLPEGSAATRGALTEAMWKALLDTPAPGVAERARSLMLSFEATDYTRAEWNFCQSRPAYDPAHGQTVCHSNDRKSYLTWGPNGATAGHGREVQNVLHAVDTLDETLIDSSFGGEAAAVRRMLEIPEAGRATETFLCGVWVDPARREIWAAGFRRLGQVSAVRRAYDDLYRSSSFDGGKIAAFQRAYTEKGYTPTEVDFAFFTDRAAHTSVGHAALAAVIPRGLSNWKVRRRIALQLRAGNANQREDRLGRDVAFYVDAASQAELGAEERTAWRKRGARRASDVGLSDSRLAAPFAPAPAIAPPPASEVLTAAERAACPAAVLDSLPPP